MLNQQFKRQDETREEDKKEALANITMAVRDDLEELFAKLWEVHMIYSGTSIAMTDKEMILEARTKLPKSLYDSTIKLAEIKFKEDNGLINVPFTIEALQRAVTDEYKKLNKKEGQVFLLNIYKVNNGKIKENNKTTTAAVTMAGKTMMAVESSKVNVVFMVPKDTR